MTIGVEMFGVIFRRSVASVAFEDVVWLTDQENAGQPLANSFSDLDFKEK